MYDPQHLNARADECSAPVVERGRRIVQYHGEGYILAGFYFARCRNGERELYYILRSRKGDTPDVVSGDVRSRDQQVIVPLG